MKICLIISSLRSGGAERVLSELANYWVSNSHQVSLITIDEKASDFYDIDPSIQRHAMNLSFESNGLFAGILANVKRIITIRKIVQAQKPDVVLSFMDSTNILCCISLVGTKIPLFVSERIDPFERKISLIRTLIRPYLYRNFAKKVVVQTLAVEVKCQSNWSISNIKVISNPISTHHYFSAMPRDKIILSVARLYPQKRHENLIRAFHKTNYKCGQWKLIICGDGPLKQDLIGLVNKLELSEYVLFTGSIKNISEYFNLASIFCLSSSYEGFPNALLEALSMGCACISTDCKSGPREILEDGRLGILVPVDDVEAMAEALRRLMQSPELREQFGSHADYVREYYHLDKISRQWLNLFESVPK
jgi:glycosyltransferase involved in cell wall biosynthesis